MAGHHFEGLEGAVVGGWRALWAMRIGDECRMSRTNGEGACE
jgi:hypothetical protein